METADNRKNLKGMTLQELEQEMVAFGQSAFRGRQLFQWINQKKISDFSEMTNLKKDFRVSLEEHYRLPKLTVHSEERSSDGTVKYLVQLPDGETVEAVYIPMENRNTLCVSTQVGCKMACTFCATGYQQFTRDLKTWEIVDQVIALDHPGEITNVVVMGMGEPFDNYVSMMKALEILQHPLGTQIGKRHITVSTVGVSDQIQPFIEANLGKLAISLHGTTDEQRSKIMPINRRFPMDQLLGTCRNLVLKGKTRITFEYLMIKDFNDSDADARRLAKLLRGIPSKINLLAYNENPFIDFKRPDEDRVLQFQNLLLRAGYTATFRKSRGRDIAGACGQLRTQEERAQTVSRQRNPSTNLLGATFTAPSPQAIQ